MILNVLIFALMFSITIRRLDNSRLNAFSNSESGRFLRMMQDKDGYEAAKQLIHTASPSEGFTTLWERKRLDMSVEAHVLKTKYHTLFTEEERDICKKKACRVWVLCIEWMIFNFAILPVPVETPPQVWKRGGKQKKAAR